VNAPRRILAVQLADIGDMTLTLPALGSLRASFPRAHLTVLTTPGAAAVVPPLCADRIMTMQRAPRSLAGLWGWLRLLAALVGGRFDTVFVFHHLSTGAGSLKYALIAAAAGVLAGHSRRYGLENGRGFFLTDRLSDDGFGAQHQAEYWRALVALAGAVQPPPADARPHTTPADRAWAAALAPSAGIRLVVHAGSGGYSRARRWDPAAFAETIGLLTRENPALQVVLVGGPGDDGPAVRELLAAASPPIAVLDLIGKTTLGQLSALLATADVFLGADSGVMHLAAAAGARVAALFGPSNAAAWRPYTPEGRAIVLRSGVECSPCSYVETGVGARDGCAARTCMRLITPQMAASAVSALAADAPDTFAHPFPAGRALVSMPDRAAPTIDILGFPVSRVTNAAWMTLLEGWAEGERPRHVCTLNPEMIMIARKDPIFAAIVRRCALTVPDGVGLLWAARWIGQPLAERVTGSDGLFLIAERAARHGWGVFLLGAADGVAAAAADRLRAGYPGLRIVGVRAGSPAPAEEDALVHAVNASGAAVLLVAYGAPEQDKWIARNLSRLQVKMAMGVGGSFDFAAGVVPRAPERWRALGIEWLYRLLVQPWRIRRMLRLPAFVFAVIAHHRPGRARGAR
jgi:exopolysaccharide biosynthesis WecB/TagA/CpsF family protein